MSTRQEDQFPEVAAAIRAGINDAYRLGVGAAISVLLEYRTRTVDPISFDAAIAQLQLLSVHVGSRAQK